MSERFFVLAEELIALASVHVKLGQVRIRRSNFIFSLGLGFDGGGEIVQGSLEVLKLHVALATTIECLRKT